MVKKITVLCILVIFSISLGVSADSVHDAIPYKIVLMHLEKSYPTLLAARIDTDKHMLNLEFFSRTKTDKIVKVNIAEIVGDFADVKPILAFDLNAKESVNNYDPKLAKNDIGLVKISNPNFQKGKTYVVWIGKKIYLNKLSATDKQNILQYGRIVLAEQERMVLLRAYKTDADLFNEVGLNYEE